jgi:hypothetical protein
MYVEQNSKVTLTNPLSKICHVLGINNTYIFKLNNCSLLDCMIRPDNADPYLFLLNELDEKIKSFELQYEKNVNSIEMIEKVIKSLININNVK